MTIFGQFSSTIVGIRHDIDFMKLARSDTNLFTEFYMLSTQLGLIKEELCKVEEAIV